MTLIFSDYDDLPEEEQIRLVQENGTRIQYIQNPSEAVQLAAVQQNGVCIYFIDDPSDIVKMAAVKKSFNSLIYIKNPNEEIIKYCLYECEFSNVFILKKIYDKLTSDEDKIYFKMKYGNIIDA